MINVKVTKTQHPKNAKAINRTTKGRPNPLEKVGKVTQ
jgi:hypothetical protein